MERIRVLYKKYEELFNYLVVGGLTTVVSMALFYGCVWTVLDGTDAVQLQIANVISWSGAVLFAYVTNRRFVFHSRETNILREMSSFVLSRLLTLLLDMGVMFLLVTVMKADYNLSKLVSMVLVTVGNYVISKLLVFRGK